MITATMIRQSKNSEGLESIELESIELPLKFMAFPTGERHVQVDVGYVSGAPGSDRWNPFRDVHSVDIFAQIYTSDDVIDLLLTHDAVKRLVDDKTSIYLKLPYIPFARQDRVANKGEPLSIKVFASLINSLCFDKVTVYDPHSDVAPALLNNCDVVSAVDLFSYFNNRFKHGTKKYVLVAPDAGSVKKVESIASMYNLKMIRAEKTRDTKTGKLSGTRIIDKVPENVELVVVDDICDGGGTFILLAQELRKHTDQPFHLFITHGVFTKGLEELKTYYKTVSCIFSKNQPSLFPHFKSF